jgi:pyruvate dehydrogenase E1 component beta subunit
MLASIPGLVVVAPSTPADGYALTATALAHDGPVVLCEPKLLSTQWLELLGRQGRDTMTFDVPAAGACGVVAEPPERVPFGQAALRREGQDVTVASLAVGVHRALQAAEALAGEAVSCEVIDLRSLRPLDAATVTTSVRKTGRLVVVDEDYRDFGLSGELAAVTLEAGLTPGFARVCCEETLPYSRHLEDAALPSVARIARAVRAVMGRSTG